MSISQEQSKYSPQTRYDFIINTGDDEVLSDTVLRIDRPSCSYSSDNERETVRAVFREYTDVDVYGKLLEWEKYPRPLTINLISMDGDVVERIYSPMVEVRGLKPDNLDYTVNEQSLISVIFAGRFTRERINA